MPNVDECDYVHVDTVAHEAGVPRGRLVAILVEGGELHRCHPHDDDLFLPVDLAWSLVAGRAGSSA